MKFKRIYVEITNVCNLKCKFCSPLNRTKRFMSVEEFAYIISQIKPFTTYIYLHIKGEPLLHPHLKDILKICEDNEIMVNITTNGTLLLQNASMLLNSSAVRQVNISVHSFSEQNENTKYIEQVAQFGKMAEISNKPYVSYRMWSGDENGNLNESSKEIIRKLGSYFNKNINPNEMMFGRNSAKLSSNIYISLMNEFQWPNLEMQSLTEYGTCHGGKEMLGILADGTVVPCCLDGDGVINLGNIFNNELKDILTKQRYCNLIKGFKGGKISEALCQKCTYRLRFDKNNNKL